jgi:hypothetical protein
LLSRALQYLIGYTGRYKVVPRKIGKGIKEAKKEPECLTYNYFRPEVC